MSRDKPQPLQTPSGRIETVLGARQRDVADLSVRRVLPARARKMVGPFILFDHMGPNRLPAGGGVDVPPHPHIHLATVTYLFDGELVHRDSLGSRQPIRPGDINWMHAGSGIVHSERTDADERRRESRIHGIQLWVALPRASEETMPSFHHYPKSALPAWTHEGVTVRLLVGVAYGYESPVRVASPTLYIDAALEAGAVLTLPDGVSEIAAYVVEGSALCDGQRFVQAQMVVFAEPSGARLETEDRSRILLVGGEPLDGERHIWWNFVSSSQERIAEAERDWRADRFPAIPGDDAERMPMPDYTRARSQAIRGQ